LEQGSAELNAVAIAQSGSPCEHPVDSNQRFPGSFNIEAISRLKLKHGMPVPDPGFDELETSLPRPTNAERKMADHRIGARH